MRSSQLSISSPFCWTAQVAAAAGVVEHGALAVHRERQAAAPASRSRASSTPAPPSLGAPAPRRPVAPGRVLAAVEHERRARRCRTGPSTSGTGLAPLNGTLEQRRRWCRSAPGRDAGPGQLQLAVRRSRRSRRRGRRCGRRGTGCAVPASSTAQRSSDRRDLVGARSAVDRRPQRRVDLVGPRRVDPAHLVDLGRVREQQPVRRRRVTTASRPRLRLGGDGRRRSR